MGYKDNLLNCWHNINNHTIRKFLIILLMVIVFDYTLLPWSVMAQAKEEIADVYLYSGYLNDLNLLSDEVVLKMPETKDDFTYLSMPETTSLTDFDIASIINPEQNNNKLNKLPKNPNLSTDPAGHFVLTAYNSEVGQCDDSPCITANGFNVCTHGIEDTVATNVLPFGTKVKIPALFGERIFIVRDRMNKRYTNRLDVWMKEKKDAKKFGVRVAKIEIVAKQ